MRAFFLLSGGHEELPRLELEACLEADCVPWRHVLSLGRAAVLDLEGEPPTRMGLCQELGEVSCLSRSLGEVLDAARASPPRVRGSFAVRSLTIPRSLRCGAASLEPRLGAVVAEATGARVDLGAPETVVRLVASPQGALVGTVLHRRGSFAGRKSDLRPFFHPSSLDPKLARAMANLAGARPGATVLDPFCGTGGIAIEAALIGARALASDIDPRMVAGARANLRHLGLSAEVGRLDARCLDEAHEPGSVDAIATDPPYGRAASTWGAGVEGLLAEALPAALAVLRPGGRMCLAVPDEVPIERLARDVGFKYLFGARLRVHGSLTRHICVAERPG